MKRNKTKTAKTFFSLFALLSIVLGALIYFTEHNHLSWAEAEGRFIQAVYTPCARENIAEHFLRTYIKAQNDYLRQNRRFSGELSSLTISEPHRRWDCGVDPEKIIKVTHIGLHAGSAMARSGGFYYLWNSAFGDLPMKIPARHAKLIRAAHMGDMEQVIRLIKSKAIHLPDQKLDEFTPIMAAASMGHNDLVKLLLDNGADPAQTGPRRFTPFLAAIAGGHPDTAMYLAQFNPPAPTEQLTTAMVIAAKHGAMKSVELAIEHGADVNMKAKYHYGEYPSESAPALDEAVAQGWSGITSVLLENGAQLGDLWRWMGNVSICHELEDLEGDDRRAEYLDTAELTLRTASGEKYAKAWYQLGQAYEKCKFITNNPAKAFRWYEKSADHGHAEAQYKAGSMSLIGHGAPKEPTKAVQYLAKAAEKDHPSALTMVGMIYFRGQYTDQDYEKAFYYFKKASQTMRWDLWTDNPRYYLGQMYEKGLHVSQDFKEAFRYYHWAGNHGHAESQLAVARFYEEGLGVEQSSRKACIWKCFSNPDELSLGGSCLQACDPNCGLEVCPNNKKVNDYEK